MAENTALEKYLTCSLCLETFKDPVSLGCNHSFCHSCVQDYWKKNETRNCPVCRRKFSKDNTEVNFALKELCDSFTGRLADSVSSKSGGAGDDQAVLSEKAKKRLQQLQTEFESLTAEKQSYEDLEKTYIEMVQFSKKQGVQCERQIKAEFQRLHSFLQEEEQRALSDLREERLTKADNMDRELQKVREKLSLLNNNIQVLEKHLQIGGSSPQPQSPAPRLQPKAGLLLNQAKVLGNLGFRVWSNMKRIISYSPVILDPNTAYKILRLSEDLRGVRNEGDYHKVPDNLERFSYYADVLGSEGFSSGIHHWDVEVGDLPYWVIGVAKESVDRQSKKTDSPDVWALSLINGTLQNRRGALVPGKSIKKLRVKLDYDLGEVSFYDVDRMKLLYTHSDTFSEKLFPFFSVGTADDAETKELRILPCDHPQT